MGSTRAQGQGQHQDSSEHLFSSSPSAKQGTNAVLFLVFLLVASLEEEADRAEGEKIKRKESCGVEGCGFVMSGPLG